MAEQRLILNFKGKQREINARICSTFLSKFKGFMFSLSKKPLLFVFEREKDVSIHTLFVFQKLLVVWLDDNKKVRNMEVMKPFISFKKEKAKYVLEIPLKSRLF